MSLSECEHCGGHIPLGPNATNRCEKCGRHVLGEPAVWSEDRIYNCESCGTPLHLPGYCCDCSTTPTTKFVVQLPPRQTVFGGYTDGYNMALKECADAIRAAGGVVEEV